MKSIYEVIAEAKQEAYKQGVEANTIIINEKYRVIKPFSIAYRFVRMDTEEVTSYPAMFLGMNVLFSDLEEFDDETAFVMTKVDRAEFDNELRKLKEENSRLKSLLLGLKQLMQEVDFEMEDSDLGEEEDELKTDA